MKCVTSSGYLRYPHIHGDLLVFASEDDIWLAPADGGRAWRLSADGAQVSYPRFSRDGARVALTSWRDGGPEKSHKRRQKKPRHKPAVRSVKCCSQCDVPGFSLPCNVSKSFLTVCEAKSWETVFMRILLGVTK